jgi:hypothetical protein
LRARGSRPPRRLPLAPVHDCGIHLLRPGCGEHCAAPGVEQRIVLKRGNRGGNGVERVTTLRENIATGIERTAQSAQSSTWAALMSLRRNVPAPPCTASANPAFPVIQAPPYCRRFVANTQREVLPPQMPYRSTIGVPRASCVQSLSPDDDACEIIGRCYPGSLSEFRQRASDRSAAWASP